MDGNPSSQLGPPDILPVSPSHALCLRAPSLGVETESGKAAGHMRVPAGEAEPSQSSQISCALVASVPTGAWKCTQTYWEAVGGPPGLGPGRRLSPHPSGVRQKPKNGLLRASRSLAQIRMILWGMVAGGWDREAPLGAVWLPPLPFSEQEPLHSPSPAGPRIRGSSYRHSVSGKRRWAVAIPGEPREAPGRPGSRPDRAHAHCPQTWNGSEQ